MEFLILSIPVVAFHFMQFFNQIVFQCLVSAAVQETSLETVRDLVEKLYINLDIGDKKVCFYHNNSTDKALL